MDWSKLNTANIKAAGNAVIFIAALFLSGALTFPPGTSEATQHLILQWDAWILTTVAGVNGVLHFLPDFTVPTAKAGSVAKALLIGLLALGALAMTAPGPARATDLRVGSCGRSGCSPTPSSNVAPAPGSQQETQTIFQLLLSIQTQVVADLTANETAAATPLPVQTAALCEKPATWNSATGVCSVVEVQDPLGAACFTASITFINDLQSIGGVSSPVLVVNGGPLGVAENARLIDLWAKQAVANITFQGLPQYWKQGCDPWLLDYATQFNLDVAGLAGANALLMKFLPVAMLEKYHLKARM